MGMNMKVITLQPDMQAMFENLLKDAIYKQVDRSGCLHIHMVLEHLAIKQITSLRYFNLPVWVPLGDLFNSLLPRIDIEIDKYLAQNFIVINF